MGGAYPIVWHFTPGLSRVPMMMSASRAPSRIALSASSPDRVTMPTLAPSPFESRRAMLSHTELQSTTDGTHSASSRSCVRRYPEISRAKRSRSLKDSSAALDLS